VEKYTTTNIKSRTFSQKSMHKIKIPKNYDFYNLSMRKTPWTPFCIKIHFISLAWQHYNSLHLSYRPFSSLIREVWSHHGLFVIGFPPVRIWYGQSVYWKVCPCPVGTKPKTAKCPYILQKNLMSVPIMFRIFCLKNHIVCKIYQKSYENYKKS
jgi:hypothetical protein